jgi:hypothetical protein
MCHDVVIIWQLIDDVSKSLIMFLPLSESLIVILPPPLCFLTSWFYTYDFKTKLQFAPIPLCDINGVKYIIKNINTFVILPLHNVCNCNFTPII